MNTQMIFLFMSVCSAIWFCMVESSLLFDVVRGQTVVAEFPIQSVLWVAVLIALAEVFYRVAVTCEWDLGGQPNHTSEVMRRLNRRRHRTFSRRFRFLYFGLLTWIAPFLVQYAARLAAPNNYAVEIISVALFVAGMYSIWGWRLAKQTKAGSRARDELTEIATNIRRQRAEAFWAYRDR